MRELESLFEKYDTLLMRKQELVKKAAALKAVKRSGPSAEAKAIQRDIEKILG